MIPSTTTASSLVTALTATGLKVPHAATRWLKVRSDVAALGELPPLDLQAEADRLLDEDVSSVVEQMVRRRTDDAARTQVLGDLAEAAAGNAVRAIRANADALVVKARKGFDLHANALAAHAHAYDPDQRPEDVLAAGSAARDAWAAIHDASAALDAYLVLRGNLYGSTATVDAVVETYDGDWWRRVDAQDAWQRPDRWHRLARLDIPLQLNTWTEELALIDSTPEKALRHEPAFDEGFIAHKPVRA